MKHLILIVLLALFFFFVITRCGVGVSADYPLAAIWHDTTYHVSVEQLMEDEVGRYIGRIQKLVSKMPTKNGEANVYPPGSRIYAIKGISTNEAIAIEIDGQYRVNTHVILDDDL